MLNNRTIEIIKDLIENEEITVKELAQKFKTSVRTIYYDLENINYYLKKNNFQGTLKNGKKIFFETEEKEDIKCLVGNGTLFCSEERKDYLVMKLFFRGMLVLNKEAEILKVTRKTIEVDIKEIKKEAKEYGAELTSLPAKGISFRGMASGVRILMILYQVKMLVQKHKLKPLSLELLEEIYEFSDGKKLEKITKKIICKYMQSASIFSFYTFIAIMITDKVIPEKDTIIESEQSEFSKVKFTEQEIGDLKCLIESEGLELKEECYAQLMVMIKRGERGFEEHHYDHNFIGIYKKAEQFLEELWNCYFDKEQVKEIRELPTDKSELKFLALRFENAIYKYKFNCREDWKLKNEFPKRLKELYNNIERISGKYFGELLEEDIERLTYTASDLMNKIEEKRRILKKVIIVHYGLGIPLQRDIAKQLSALWHVEVVKILLGHEFDEFLENNDMEIDGIIIFENGYLRRIKTDIPVIALNIFSLEESSQILFDYGYSKKIRY